MCGIIGIIGTEAVCARIVTGLKRLEYRGYDSAGVATLDGGRLARRRAEGKLTALEDVLAREGLGGTLGIGHTRWATHGAPSARNAHPHISQRVAVVHNGIIENYRVIKEQLIAAGVEFSSDTDSEVIAHLFAHHLDESGDMHKAAQATFSALQGAYAVGLIIEGAEDYMLAARAGSPLVIGHGDGEHYLGSDAFALAPFTNRVTYLHDGDWAVISRDGAEIFDMDGQPAKRAAQIVDASAAMVDKGQHRHFMAKEIFEQPDVLSRSFGQYLDAARGQVAPMPPELDLTAKRVMLIACGTAYFAAMVARNWLERTAKIAAEVDIASEFRYRDAPLDKDCLAVFISQSGETADTLAALAHCKANGLKTLGIVNVPESSLAREADACLPTYAGPEIGVASTKAFIAQCGALAALAIAMGRARGTIDAKTESGLVETLLATPRQASQILQQEAAIKRIADGFTEFSNALFIGRGAMYPLALEGALKLKEISYIHAEGFPAGELKHGSIALVDEHVPIIVVAPDDALFGKTISNMQEVMARKGKVILLASGKGIKAVGEGLFAAIELPEIDPFTAPILYAIPLQLLAYYAACAKGTDVDQPRNLAKSVTVE